MNIHTKVPMPVLFLFVLLSITIGSSIYATADEGDVISWQVEFSQSDLLLGTKDGYATVDLKDCVATTAPGKPMLPSKILHFIIDPIKTIDRIEVVEDRVNDIPGTFNVYPSQKLYLVTEEPEFTPPDEATYASRNAFPARTVIRTTETVMGGNRIATIAVHPVTYIPIDKRLVLHSRVSFRIVLKERFTDESEKTVEATKLLKINESRTEKSRAFMRDAIKGIVVNPDGVDDQERKIDEIVAAGFSTKDVFGTFYDYLIITSSAIKNSRELDAFVAQKESVNCDVEVMSVDEIYAAFEGRDNQEKIRTYIKDRQENRGALFVFLIGDNSIVPVRTIFDTSTNEVYSTDVYYACLDGTWDPDEDGQYCEADEDAIDIGPDVFVGRLLATQPSDLEHYMSKVEKYRNNINNYSNRLLFLGAGSEHPNSVEGYRLTSDIIESFSETLNLDIYRIHPQSPSEDRIPEALEQINNGYHFIMHADHGWPEGICIGSPAQILTLNINGLTNTEKPSILFSCGCTTVPIHNEFLVNLLYGCVGKSWIAAEGGGIGYIGNSATAYGYYLLCELFFKDIFERIAETGGTSSLGAALAAAQYESLAGMLGISTVNSIARGTFQYILLGDPDVTIGYNNTPSVVINDGAGVTGSRNAALSIRRPDDHWVQVQYSNEDGNWTAFEEVHESTGKDWVLTAGDGQKTVTIKFKDNEGNISQIYSDSIILDTVPPHDCSATVLNSNCNWLTVHAVDDLSGVETMRFSNDGAEWLAEEPFYVYAGSWTFLSLSGPSGYRTLYAQFKDYAGNWSDPVSTTFYYDAPPMDCSIVINDGAAFTSTRDVSLLLEASYNGGDPQAMWLYGSMVYHYNGPYMKTMAVRLTEEDGRKTVGVVFEGSSAWAWSEIVFDDIILDAHPPTNCAVTIENNNGYVSSHTCRLNLSAVDAVSGVDTMRFSNDGNTWSQETAYATTASWELASGDGRRVVHVQFKDRAGNWAPAVNCAVYIDSMSGRFIEIEDGALATNNRSVHVDLSAGALEGEMVRMQFSCDFGATWSAPEPYAITKICTLPAGEGNKAVYVKFEDTQGNWSDPISDSIMLDLTAPARPAVWIEPQTGFTNSDIIQVNLFCDDLTSCEVRLSYDGSIWMDWIPYEPHYDMASYSYMEHGVQLPSGDGQKTVYVQFMDCAGNESEIVSCSIVLDTVPPRSAQVIPCRLGNAEDICYDSSSRDISLWFFVGDTASDIDTVTWSFNGGTTWSAWQPFVMTAEHEGMLVDVTLPSGDGEKTICAKFRDRAGNESEVRSCTVTLDTTPPTGTVILEGGAAYTNTRNVTLAMSASSDAWKMSFSNDNMATWSDWSCGVTLRYQTLTEGDGTKLIYVKFKDRAGNESSVVWDAIILDREPPHSGSVSINSGSRYAFTQDVTLTLSAVDDISGVGEVGVANDRDAFPVPVSWESFPRRTASWRLSDGDGEKFVYVKFRDRAGNEADMIYSDRITLITTPPTVDSFSVNSGADYVYVPNSHALPGAFLSWDVHSLVPDRVEAQFSNDNITWSNAGSAGLWALTPGEGLKTVYARFRNGDGAWSETASDTITVVVDATPPAGCSVMINGGDQYTRGREVTLALSAADATSGVSWMTIWEDGALSSYVYDGVFDPEIPFTLSSGDGLKTITAVFYDAIGNSAEVSDMITLDTTPPQDCHLYIDLNAEFTNTRSVDLAVRAWGASQVQCSNDGQTWSAPSSYDGMIENWQLSAGDGVKTVYVKFGDAAGNWSSPIRDTIVLDTTAPVGTIKIQGGAEYARSSSVILTLSAYETRSGLHDTPMRFSNDLKTWSGWEAYATTKTWTLLLGDGEKKVYVQFRDNAGNVRTVYDTIVLDKTAPVIGPIVGATANSAVPVSLMTSASRGSYVVFDAQAQDAASDISLVEVRMLSPQSESIPLVINAKTGRYVAFYQIPIDFDPRSPYIIYSVKATDKAGNVSYYSKTGYILVK